jgi:N-acetylglucosaminyl-diphospho-decaprenol L-rhamnosyltransferase
VNSPTWHIAIVNYRTTDLAVRAIRAAHQAVPSARLVVVDNASDVTSAKRLRQQNLAEVVALQDNRGYGAALNAGTSDARAPFLLLLNADVAINAAALQRFVDHFQRLAKLGIVAPRLLSDDGTPQPSSRRFPTHTSLLWSRQSPLSHFSAYARGRYVLPEPSAFTLTDVVAGACMAIRREVWQELGGMDERFFLFAEDTDLCYRAKKAGWLVGYDPAARVDHVWGASTHQDPRKIRKLHAQSLEWYFRKHYPEKLLTNLALATLLRAHALWNR